MPIDDMLWRAPQGGEWTYMHEGFADDSYRAYAVKGVPCQRRCLYGVARPRSYSIAAHTEDNCITMVHAWCHRHAFLYMWVLRGGLCVFSYKAEDIDKQRGPEAYQTTASRAAGDLAKCVARLRSSTPKKLKGTHACA